MAVDHETRLSLAEERISRHEKMHEETQESVKEIANGVARLVEGEGRRSQYEETFKRLFDGQEKFDVRLTDFIDHQTEKELAAYKGIIWKIAGLVGLVIASLIAGHFGGKSL